MNRKNIWLKQRDELGFFCSVLQMFMVAGYLQNDTSPR